MSFLNKLTSKFQSLIQPNTKELRNCIISPSAILYEPCSYHEVSVGDGTCIHSNGRILLTTIEKYCSIGPDFNCGWGMHPIHGISTSPMFYSTSKQNGRSLVSYNKFEERKKIVIGNDVFIGRNVIILDGVTIGDGAVIGAGAVVSRDIPPYAVAVGSPIRVIKYRFSPEIIEQLLIIKWWDQDKRVLDAVFKYCFDINSFLQEVKK